MLFKTEVLCGRFVYDTPGAPKKQIRYTRKRLKLLIKSINGLVAAINQKV